MVHGGAADHEFAVRRSPEGWALFRGSIKGAERDTAGLVCCEPNDDHAVGQRGQHLADIANAVHRIGGSSDCLADVEFAAVVGVIVLAVESQFKTAYRFEHLSAGFG